MAAPPPTDDDDEQAAFVFGIAAVEEHLADADLDWPAAGDEVVAAAGNPAIPYNPHGSTVRLGDIVERVDRDSFDSRRDFLNAIHPAFEDYRRSHTGGLVDQIRSFLPI